MSLYTYPSVASTIFDVPEPKEIFGEFFYNYFVPDERESVQTRSDTVRVKRHRGKPAREVVVTFTPLNAVVPDSPILSEIDLSSSQKRTMLLRNTKKIQKETEFMTGGTVAVKLQDSSISERLLADVEATLLQKQIDTQALSPTETLLRYASETTDNVDGQAILDSVNVDDANEYVSIDPVTGKPFEVQKAGEVSSLTFNASLSPRFAADIANSAIKTPLSPAAEVFQGTVVKLQGIQNRGRSGANSSRYVKSTDFVRTFDPVQVEKMNIDDVFLGGNTVMGYRIRKTDLATPNATEDIFITNTEATNYIDEQVKYGAIYNYSIAVVYLIRVFSIQGSDVVAADLLVESRESPSINVACEEAVPPNAPDGLEFYLIQNRDLVIEWNFPVNVTEDIKRFQVFRRKSINDPFQLFAELDFDDSTIQTERYENVPSYSRRKLTIPRASVCDYAFDLESKFIYAVCAIDAHDLSSPYSEQFMVHYDLFSASLVTEFISEKNAPKPYPNFLLRSQLTEDAMKDSDHTSLTCYFDPEYLKVFNGSGDEVDFLQTSDTEVSYKIQLIHLNFQQSVVADIIVK